ncbi:MAG TPA: sensor histidine kinase [Parafilimonas sp.]|nr:sensor histidine kinase [Parafilimonas sp.]
MNQNITSIKKISWHLLFWILFFGAWYFLRYDSFSTRALAAKLTLLKVADLALMVYVSNYILVPYLLYRKKYFLFGVIFIALVFSFSVFKMYLESLIMHNPGMFSLKTRFKARMYDNTIPHFLLVSTGVAFKLLLDHAKAQKRIGEIAREKAEAELNFLKSQINPHFLFNSINSVYFLIDKKNEDARNALHTFSEMLRYQLYECNGSKVSLKKEIAYLRDYISVQQLRKNKNLQLQFEITGDESNTLIEPLLLIPLVENAFKHLSNFDDGKKDLITIHLDTGKDNLVFTVENTVGKNAIKAIQNESGIGLNNICRRLELLYPGKHSLTITNNGDCFKTQLQIELN